MLRASKRRFGDTSIARRAKGKEPRVLSECLCKLVDERLVPAAAAAGKEAADGGGSKVENQQQHQDTGGGDMTPEAPAAEGTAEGKEGKQADEKQEDGEDVWSSLMEEG